jgi:N-acetylglucosamine-6-sulfatase|tara:strand:- start:295 stop:486 length:192 start_codon:yes stop_codon:yes gene_type:complete
MGYKAVRTDSHKYIQYTDLDGMDELYDLDADPYEMENVIDQADQAALLEELRAELARLLAATE